MGWGYATLTGMKILRWTGNTFIVAGATLLFFVVYELVGTSLVTNHHQDALAAEWDDSLLKPGFTPPSASPSAKPAPKKYSGPPPIGKLIIPKIGLSKFMVEGVSLARLAYGPGHYPRTAKPGHVGTTGIACHRTGWGSPCINVDRLQRGDEIILELKEGCAQPPCRFVYRLTNTKIVQPTDGWVLDGDPSSKAKTRLTLTTCTPKYTSLKRLILWADLVSPAAGLA